MIQPQSRLKVADNTGARIIQCIRVIGRSQKTMAGVGREEAVEAMRLAGHKLPVATRVVQREGASDGH